MNKGKVQVICGFGQGKTTAAIGTAVSSVSAGKTVIMIQFLKGNLESEQFDVLKKLEPDMKMFCFEKSPLSFEELSDREKEDEMLNIRNGLNFARKVMGTGECDLLILDELLGLIDCQIVSVDEVKNLLSVKEETMDIIITGKVFPEELADAVDEISKIENVDIDNIIH